MGRWKYGVLDDVVIKGSSNISLSKIKSEEGNFPVYGAKGFVKNVSFYQQEKGYLAIIKDGAGIGRVSKHPAKSSILATMQYLIPKEGFNIDFINYFLNGIDFEKHRNGSTIPHIYFKDYKTERFPILPLPEQERVVAILDEAFAAIATATANAEKNLANAQELFESYLSNLSCNKRPLGNFVDIQTGKLNANAAVEGGKYSFFTCSREVYEIDNYAFDCEAILLAGNNATGDFNVKHFTGRFNAYQRTYVITIKVGAQLLYRFLYFQIIKSLKELKESSVGTGTKFLKLGMIKALMVSTPPLEEQRRILNTLEQLKSNTEHLGTIYQREFEVLTELKQSILHKAITGELTADAKVTDRTLSDA